MEFYKLQASENDFILILTNDKLNFDIKEICNRNKYVGADGIITIDSYNNIKIYNSDGSKAKMCGNGLRCVSKLLYYLYNKKENKVYLDNNEIDLTQIDEDNATLTLPSPIMISYKDGYLVDLLNNHYVIVVNNIDKFKFNDIHFTIQKEKKCNLHAIEIVSRNTIKIKSYEYGANYTRSCGSGSMASFFAMNMTNKVDNCVDVICEGGMLNCKYEKNNYILTGPVKLVYKGELYGF